MRGAINTVMKRSNRWPPTSRSSPARRKAGTIHLLANRRAESLATPETECLYAIYWFRPILSELIGAATESADVNEP